MKLLLWIKKNPGPALLAGNAGLLTLWLLLQDPFGLSRQIFASRNRIARVDMESTKAIEIRSFEKQAFIRLERGAKIPGEDKNPQYQWQMTRQWGTKQDSLSADRERIKELFAALERAKRAYSIPVNPENEKTAEMSADASGRPRCTIVSFISDGSTTKLCIGKSSLRGNDSYVRVNEEGQIFIVEENLKTAVGAGDPDFFRNRRLLPDISRDSINGIQASGPGRQVQLTHSAQKWQLTLPMPAAVNMTQMNLLLGDLVDLKATAFPAEIPRDLDRKKAFELEISYKTNMVDSQIIKLSVLGQKDFSSYIVRDSTGTLAEVTSMYLADLLDPEEKLMEKQERR